MFQYHMYFVASIKIRQSTCRGAARSKRPQQHERAASLVALTFSLQYEIMTRKTEGFPGGGQGSTAMWRGAVGNLYGFQVWRKPDRGCLNRRFKSRAGATIAKLTEQAKRSETTGSSPVATTRAEPNRKVRLIVYSFG
jgi:hypothetical protein